MEVQGGEMSIEMNYRFDRDDDEIGGKVGAGGRVEIKYIVLADSMDVNVSIYIFQNFCSYRDRCLSVLFMCSDPPVSFETSRSLYKVRLVCYTSILTRIVSLICEGCTPTSWCSLMWIYLDSLSIF